MSYRELLAARSRLERAVAKSAANKTADQRLLLARVEAALKARRDRKLGVCTDENPEDQDPLMRSD